MSEQEKQFLEKLWATFRIEAQEHLHEIAAHIVLLEQQENNAARDIILRVLGKLHTLKGAARAVNHDELEKLCHAMESIFSVSANRDAAIDATQFDLLHQAVNAGQALLHERTGRLRNTANRLIVSLERASREIAHASHGSAQEELQEQELTAPMPEEVPVEQPDDPPADAEQHSLPGPLAPDMIRIDAKSLDVIRHQTEALLSVELSLQHQINDLMALADQIAIGKEGVDGQAHAALPLPLAGSAAATLSQTLAAGEDYKIRNTNESAHLLQRCRQLANNLGQTRRNLRSMRTRLMDAALQAALVPVSVAIEQLPGLVRNLARNRHKQVQLRVEGETIQIDRRVADIVREGLLHLVTNAVDHGIESVETRLAQGKPASGQIRIEIVQTDGNRIIVTVSDDGSGIDLPQVVAAAVRQQDTAVDEAAALTDQEKINLILRVGVSTSDELTAVSGRGVGLAVVAEKVASIGGSLSIETSSGKGCSFRMLLPVRLATVHGLVVHVQSDCYFLPLSGIECVRSIKTGDIQTVEGRSTLQHNHRVIPVVRLGQLLQHHAARSPGESADHIAIIVRHGSSWFSVLVDEIVSHQEVLPKSLGKQLRRVRYITGVTQLGDGRLVPVIGVDDIAQYGLTASPLPDTKQAEKERSGLPKQILIAEDSLTSRLLLKHILEGAGYQVEAASDGLEAMARLRHNKYDALITDIEMPGLDGLALTEQVRRNPATSSMPVILVTSLQAPQERQRGLMAGADAYVTKGSFNQDNLLDTVRRLIQPWKTR